MMRSPKFRNASIRVRTLRSMPLAERTPRTDSAGCVCGASPETTSWDACPGMQTLLEDRAKIKGLNWIECTILYIVF